MPMFQEVQFIVSITLSVNAELSEEELKKKFEQRISLHDIQDNKLDASMKILHIKEEAEIYQTEENKVCFVGTEEELKNLDLLMQQADNSLPKKI